MKGDVRVTGHEFFITAACALLGWMAGFLMHRSDFCMAGMFRDYFLFRNAFMLRALLLAVVLSMIFFEILRRFEIPAGYPFPLMGAPSLANLLGGFLFGTGMVLAGGCVVGTLYRLGAGSLLSGLALFGIVVGSTAYAEIHPLWMRFSAATALTQRATLPQWLGVSPTLAVFCLTLLAGWLFLRWRKAKLWSRPSAVEGYLQPWKAAVGLAVIGLLSCVVTGMPLGITTAYAKVGSLAQQLLWPSHLAALEYFHSQPLQMVAPFSERVYRGGPGPVTDAISMVQYPLILGILFGSTYSALSLREFRVRWRFPLSQAISALLGGALMGLACRLAPSCNLWHLLGGLPVLALQSLLFVAGMIPGAWLGSRLLVRYVLRG